MRRACRSLTGVARRLAANALPERIADQLQAQRQREDLGDTLDREGRVAVAARCLDTVASAQRDAELVGPQELHGAQYAARHGNGPIR